MKRPFPLYHWSPTSRRSGILKHGLKPNSLSRCRQWRPPYICFSDSPSMAWALSGDFAESPELWDLWMMWSDIPKGYETLTTGDNKSGKPTEYRVYERVPEGKDLVRWVKIVTSTTSNDMRIVCISDSHMHHRKINMPDGDMVIHAGDFSLWDDCDVDLYNKWIGEHLPKYKHGWIQIAGNHDAKFEWNNFGHSAKKQKAKLTNAIYLQDKAVEVNGLKIYGTPWSARFGADMAFNVYPQQLAAKWKLIPDDVDILVTHTPAWGVLDAIPSKEGMLHVGCPDLLVRINEIKPKLHVCGHVHFSYGQKMYANGVTLGVNAALVGKDHKLVNEPIVVEI
jgi:Icc-related predicted phosphoesterase